MPMLACSFGCTEDVALLQVATPPNGGSNVLAYASAVKHTGQAPASLQPPALRGSCGTHGCKLTGSGGAARVSVVCQPYGLLLAISYLDVVLCTGRRFSRELVADWL